MKTLYIHIGDAKTGSSTIQKYCTKNRLDLLNNGIDYIPLGLLANKGIAQHKFAFFINSDRKDYPLKTASIFDELRSYILTSDLDKFVISSEGFCSLRSEDEILTLKELMPQNIDIKIVAYLRNPCEWIESWYCQVVKNKPYTKANFNDFYQRHQAPAYDVVLKYAKFFSKENIIIKPFLKKAFIDNDLICDFFDSLGLKVKKPNKDISTNISPSIGCIETLRLLNEKLDLPDHVRNEIYDDIVKYLPKENERKYLDDSKRQKIIDKYRPIIKRIEDEILERPGYLRGIYD